MKPFELPSSLLVALFACNRVLAASPTSTSALIASTGSGPEYVSACLAASSSYNSAESVWTEAHKYTDSTTSPLGGISVTSVDYIAGASTLCDGHPRVTVSNYSTLSSGYITKTFPVTGTTTILNTYYSAYRAPSPSCSISPSDCDPLWATYLSSLSARDPQITSPPLTTPPCTNQTAASSYASLDSSIYGCGKCTIYGEGVQLVFWPEPTTVSRDMCASTPTANVTHYGPSAVITAYAGKSVGNFSGSDASLRGYATADGKETIVADGHVFTSGTAYISISRVYAVDRCTKTYGSGVTDAILALPSESVLSLRYSQDHFQRLMETDKVTGYPVNYADFNTPIPWSAWNGQNLCRGAWDNYFCTVINENYFRPQLAIPPQITELSPDFKDCQMWYNGLWDPPLALTEHASVAKPTLPASYTKTASAYTEPASPSSTVAALTATATTAVTALPNERPSTYESQPAESTHPSTASHYNEPTGGQSGASKDDQQEASTGGQSEQSAQSSKSGQSAPSVAGPTVPVAKALNPSNEPWTTSFDIGGQTYMATGSNKQAVIGTVTCSSGGPAQTLTNGYVATYGSNGCVFSQSTVVAFDDAQPTNEPATPDADTVLVTVSGSSVLTAVQSSDGGVVVAGTYTLTPGAGAVTLEDGHVLSAATNGIAVNSQTTLGVSSAQSTSGPDSEEQNSADDSGNSSSAGTGDGAGSSTETEGGSSTGGGIMPSTTENADATTGAAQTSPTSGSGASLISAPAFTSFIMVVFVGAVLAV